MKSLLIFFGLSLMALTAASQQRDTSYLKEVIVYGIPITHYTSGSKVEKIEAGNSIVTLGDGLSTATSLYLKNYGNSQLTTIALRGTTASQTAVLWNGVNINSPTLGQTDFSLIPLFFFDEVSLHYGTASSLYGSDAIGGSIMIGQTAPEFKKSSKISCFQQAGSFGRFASGIKSSYGTERFHFRTKLFQSFIRNDFSYRSPAVGYRKRQSHASVINYGLDQHVYFKISEKQTLSAELMYTGNFREIQPSVTNDQGNETLDDRHWRAACNYNNNSDWGIVHATAAYIFSDQDYTDDLTSTVRSSQFATLISVDKMINHRSNLRYGLSYNYYTATAANFNDVAEDRQDAFVSYRYALREQWIVDLNIRQSFYDRDTSPLSPSLGTEAYVVSDNNKSVILRTQVARGFRVPTLNDRYWAPGGNPLTKPEDAIHAEGGVLWSQTHRHTKLKVDATYFHSWIDRMIVWMPSTENSYWSPSNLQQVNIQGIEFSSKLENISQPIKLISEVSYSFTQSLNKNGMFPGDASTINKQLPYVPFHNGSAFISCSTNKNWIMTLHYNYTGLRYTTLDNTDIQSLKAYGLANISVSKEYLFARWSFEVKGEVKNVLDVYYENLKNRAMPGRNYSISLLINFKP